MYKVGDIVKARVTGIEPYGIFVNLEDNYTGLIHISEIDNNYISDIASYVGIGDIIYVNIIGLDEEKKHLSLSIKNINYRGNSESRVPESISSFLPLASELPTWINEKATEIKNKN